MTMALTIFTGLESQNILNTKCNTMERSATLSSILYSTQESNIPQLILSVFVGRLVGVVYVVTIPSVSQHGFWMFLPCITPFPKVISLFRSTGVVRVTYITRPTFYTLDAAQIFLWKALPSHHQPLPCYFIVSLSFVVTQSLPLFVVMRSLRQLPHSGGGH